MLPVNGLVHRRHQHSWQRVRHGAREGTSLLCRRGSRRGRGQEAGHRLGGLRHRIRRMLAIWSHARAHAPVRAKWHATPCPCPCARSSESHDICHSLPRARSLVSGTSKTASRFPRLQGFQGYGLSVLRIICLLSRGFGTSCLLKAWRAIPSGPPKPHP